MCTPYYILNLEFRSARAKKNKHKLLLSLTAHSADSITGKLSLHRKIFLYIELVMGLTLQGIKDLLKRLCVRTAVAVFIFTAVFGAAVPVESAEYKLPVAPWTLATLTNQTRLTQNLETLKINPLLNYAAQLKAEHMARLGYFAHTSPEGVTPWHWFRQAGYNYEFAGENLAVSFIDPQAIEQAWISSPSHRANLVDRNYTEMGTGVAEGYYKGKKVLFVAQVYANPLQYKAF